MRVKTQSLVETMQKKKGRENHIPFLTKERAPKYKDGLPESPKKRGNPLNSRDGGNWAERVAWTSTQEQFLEEEERGKSGESGNSLWVWPNEGTDERGCGKR